MELFKLNVTIVSNVLPPTDPRYIITAISTTGKGKWRSKLLTVEEYRTAMSFTGLESHQIEQPVQTGLMTDFGGHGHGDVAFEEEILVKMGSKKHMSL